MTNRKTSDTAKRPIIAAMKSMPPMSSELPNVNRGTPAGLFSPIVDTRGR